MILDSSFLIHVMARQDRALRKVDELEERGVPQRVPALSLYELYIGVGRGNLAERERGKIERVLRPRIVHDVDRKIAASGGVIEGELMASGERVGAADALIGATAIRFDEPVLTTNPDHFRRIPDVEVETY